MCDLDAVQGWEEYFQCLSYNTSEAHIHLKRLASEGHRIFGGQGDVERWRIDLAGFGTYNIYPIAASLIV